MKQFLNCFVLIPFFLCIFPHIPASWFWPALSNHSPFDSIPHSMQTQLPWNKMQNILKYFKQLFSTHVNMWGNILVGQVCFWDMAYQAGAYPSFSSMKEECFFSSLDGMLVHQGVTPSIKFVGSGKSDLELRGRGPVLI